MQIELARRMPRRLARLLPRSLKQAALKQAAFLRSFQKREGGFCPVCGTDTRFVYQRHNSEDGDCLRCLSFSRNRAVALAVLEHLAISGCRSLADLGGANAADIYLLAAWGGVADALRRSPRVVCSEFFDDVPPGTVKDGVLCQDARRLTFPDGCFDLVISECVFEHIPGYLAAFQEVYRVLRPGGAHIFTIPYDLKVPTTDRFARVNGEWVPILPLEMHGDRIRGSIPAYTTFGYDLPEILAKIGFRTTLTSTPPEQAERCAVWEGHVFVSVKAEGFEGAGFG